MPSSTKYQSCADAMTESFQRLNVHDQAKANSSVTFALTPLSCLATTRNSTTPHLNTSLSYSDVTQPRKRRYNTDSPSRPDYSRAQTIQTLQTTITTANFQASRKRRADLISVNNIQADAPSNRSDFDALSTQIANFNMIEPTRPKADFTFTINFSPDSSTVQFKGVCTRPVNTRVAQLKEQECVTTPVVLKIGVRQVAIKSCMKKPKCSRYVLCSLHESAKLELQKY